MLYSPSRFSSQEVESDDVVKDVIPNVEISVIDKGKGKKVKAKSGTALGENPGGCRQGNAD